MKRSGSKTSQPHTVPNVSWQPLSPKCPELPGAEGWVQSINRKTVIKRCLRCLRMQIPKMGFGQHLPAPLSTLLSHPPPSPEPGAAAWAPVLQNHWHRAHGTATGASAFTPIPKANSEGYLRSARSLTDLHNLQQMFCAWHLAYLLGALRSWEGLPMIVLDFTVFLKLHLLWHVCYKHSRWEKRVMLSLNSCFAQFFHEITQNCM